MQIDAPEPIAASSTPVVPLWTALRRGVRRRCPGCGETRLFAGYLRLAPRCESCAVQLDAFRADDAPPYFTIFIVGHVIAPLMLMLEKAQHPEPWIHMLIWPAATIALSLALLPPVKGAVVGTLWSLRIKG